MTDAPTRPRGNGLLDAIAQAPSDIASRHSPAWVSALSQTGPRPPLPPEDALRLREKLAARYREWTGRDLASDLADQPEASPSPPSPLPTPDVPVEMPIAAHTDPAAWSAPCVREPTAEDLGLRWQDQDEEDPGRFFLLYRDFTLVGEAYVTERDRGDVVKWHCKTSDWRDIVEGPGTIDELMAEARRQLVADYLKDLALGPAPAATKDKA